jgi:hypothetical protein
MAQLSRYEFSLRMGRAIACFQSGVCSVMASLRPGSARHCGEDEVFGVG